MKINKSLSTSLRLLFLAIVLLLATDQLGAQPGNPGRPHRPEHRHPRFDSTYHRPPLDSTVLHRYDSTRARKDSIGRPRPHRDSIIICHRDSMKHKPDTGFNGRPRPHRGPWHRPFPRDTSFGGGGKDSIQRPPFPRDSSFHPRKPRPPFPPDTSRPRPPFPPDTTKPRDPRPPFPPDTTRPRDPDTTRGGRPRHKIDYIETGNTEGATIQIYPNPVVSVSTMRIENAQENVSFRLYDSNGRMVMLQINLGNGNYAFSKEGLSPGVYIYEMADGNTSTKTGRIIIQ